MALGADQEARDTLRYLMATQLRDGHWHQNQWLGGTPYWQGIQLDETAFPVLLAAALDERDALAGIEVEDMVRRALGFIARTGPATEQDRWEESAGLNPFTLAVSIAALVAGAALLPAPAGGWAIELADFWNANIEHWTSVSGTPLACRLGVEGYYVLVLPGSALDHRNMFRAVIPIHNRLGNVAVRADELVGTEFLQLVRFGLRRPDDPLILDSIRVADALLKTDTPSGPVWHRYNCDGYGEHDDGSPYDGTGRGRGWPLLTGRARPLRARRRARPAALSRSDVPDGEPRRHAAGAGLGRRPDPRAGGSHRGGLPDRRCRSSGPMPSSSNC